MTSFHRLLVTLISATGIATVAADSKTDNLEQKLNQDYTGIPLVTGAKSLRYVNTEINGEPFLMMLDSGAEQIFLASSIAEKLEIDTVPYTTAKGADGKLSEIRLGPLRSLKVGGLTVGVKNACFADFPHLTTLKFPDGSTRPGAGQLGTGFISKMNVAVDYPNNRLLVPKESTDGGVSDLLTELGGTPVTMIENNKGRHFIKAELDGEEVLFLADTAASSSVVYAPAVKNFGIPLLERKTKVDTLNSKKAPVRIANVDELELGGQNYGVVQMLVFPHAPELEQLDGLPIVGILGGSLFEALRVTLDFQSDLMTLGGTRR